uniref:Protein FAR1-RELATED SEQUENCE n=1 Tax=Chenopodium quinoa TaxID=63459 RepID=A0A803LEA0_CHEQI
MEEDSGTIGLVQDVDVSITLESEGNRVELDFQNIVADGRKEFVAPAVGMEFESYDDAYNYYNCYAKEVGFRVRVKNSWFKRNSKEKYGAVLCCSSQGFKRIKDVNRLRKETRTGCPAMIRMRLVDSRRWRILEVTLEHNHLLGPRMYKTIKTVEADSKRKSLFNSNAEGQTIKLYKAVVIDSSDTGYLKTSAKETQSFSDHHNQLHLKKGDAQAIYNYLCHRSQTLQSAISEVFPRSLHRYGISLIMRKVPEKLGGLCNYDAIRKAFAKAVYETLKVGEFEAAWGLMVQQHGIANHEWLRSLYEDRVRWAPVYLKDTFFAGMSTARPADILHPFFEKYVHKQTPLKEFFDKYELALHKKHKEETLSDIESRSSSSLLKTRCSFEQQLSKVYTKEIFQKFQLEVEEMYSCFSTTQLHVDGPYIIFLVKERLLGEGNRREIRDYEVYYNRGSAEVRCICSCFNFNGYLCRHALCVLNFNGVEEIPAKYILSRWKKEYKRLYVIDHANNTIDINDRIQRFNQLYRSALRVVEEGVISLDHYSSASQAFEESLNRVHNKYILSSSSGSLFQANASFLHFSRKQAKDLQEMCQGMTLPDIMLIYMHTVALCLQSRQILAVLMDMVSPLNSTECTGDDISMKLKSLRFKENIE